MIKLISTKATNRTLRKQEKLVIKKHPIQLEK